MTLQAGKHDPTGTSGREVSVLQMTHQNGMNLTYCDNHNRLNQMEAAWKNMRTTWGLLACEAAEQGWHQGYAHATGSASTASSSDSVRVQILDRR